jgi:hypothetical protein
MVLQTSQRAMPVVENALLTSVRGALVTPDALFHIKWLPRLGNVATGCGERSKEVWTVCGERRNERIAMRTYLRTSSLHYTNTIQH